MRRLIRRPKALRPRPPKTAKPSTVSGAPAHSTVPKGSSAQPTPRPRRGKHVPKPALRAPRTTGGPKRQVGRIIDEEESSLLDLIDNLLNKGVMLNADLILALADVDLVYIRLSALLCAADRVLPPRGAR